MWQEALGRSRLPGGLPAPANRLLRQLKKFLLLDTSPGLT